MNVAGRGLALVALVALVVLAGSVGCAPADAEPSAFSITDSAGVQLVRNDGDPAVLDSATLSLVEELRIGVLDGDARYQFHQIGAFRETDDGRFFVPNGGSATVRVFDREGRFLREFGGRGDGPGELRAIGMLRLHADTVVAGDGSRVVVFDTLGRVLGGWSTRRALPASASVGELIGSASVHIALHDGTSWLGYLRRYDHSRTYEVGRPYQDTLDHQRYDILTGELLDTTTVLRRPDFIREYAIEPRGEGALIERLWDFEPASAQGKDGVRFTADSGGFYRIEVRDGTGRLLRRIERAHAPVEITDEHVREYQRRVHARYDTMRGHAPSLRTERRRLAELRPTLGHPPRLPAVRSLWPMPDGSLWVLRGDVEVDVMELADPWLTRLVRSRRQPPAWWDRFDAQGRYLGSVRLPDGFRLYRGVPDDRFTGVQLDENDVEYIVRYRVVGLPGVAHEQHREAPRRAH